MSDDLEKEIDEATEKLILAIGDAVTGMKKDVAMVAIGRAAAVIANTVDEARSATSAAATLLVLSELTRYSFVCEQQRLMEKIKPASDATN
jgi:hypothetical protein